MLIGEVIWQASDSSLSKELHDPSLLSEFSGCAWSRLRFQGGRSAARQHDHQVDNYSWNGKGLLSQLNLNTFS